MYVIASEEIEERSKKKAKEILDQMTHETRSKALVAIEDAFSGENPFEMNWEIIATALTKKSVDNYEKYGFGIWFNRNFLANVHKQIERNIAAEEISESDYEAFFANPKEEKEKSKSMMFNDDDDDDDDFNF